jgi:predicted porin
MQKKIIALAVAGLVSGAAFAQSNVTVYGVADIGYVFDRSSYTDGTKSMGKVYAGGQNGSRIGFKGSEDLGNGLSAIYHMVAGVKLDTGESDQGGLLMGRWATVGLSSKTLGTIEGGRRDSFIEQAVGTANVMKGNTTVGQVTPVFQRIQRYDNMIAYTSPSFSGVTLKAGLSSNISGQDIVPVENTAVTQSNSNNRAYSLAADYTNGGLYLAATYDYYKMQEVNNTLSTVNGYDAGNAWYLVGSYDFGMARVNAGYANINYAQNLQTAALTPAAIAARAQDDRNQWQLGVSVPFGPKDMVALNYARGTTSYNNDFSDDKSSLWGIAYFHDLSKRTNVYVAYGDINQKDSNHVKLGLDGQDTYASAFQVGMKHSF